MVQHGKLIDPKPNIRSHLTDFGIFMDGRVFNGYGLVEAAQEWEREAQGHRILHTVWTIP